MFLDLPCPILEGRGEHGAPLETEDLEMLGKFVWLEWNGERHSINIETWIPGIAPFNSLIDFGTEEKNREMYARYLKMGYLKP